ncbi:hypothetical protein [Agrobacterium sp. LAD9]|uniref:hypothetical protein n=1 Tax=Agrobacterium sp. LAD9 TaxID=2055153 RepID=UPI000D1F9BF5|nr:hypothetical protein [Agrobacterium sp. LAD9]
MTLVAGISVGGMPAFIGDLLLSWRLPSSIDIPTLKDPGVVPGLDRDYGAGLEQKLVIIRSYLIVAWAGLHSEAMRIIKELDAVLPTEGSLNNPEPIFRILDTCCEGVEMIALLAWEDQIFPFCVRTCGFELEDKRIYLLGTGATDFFAFLKDNPDLVPSSETADGQLARASMLRFAARSMAMQLGLGTGFENSWGGGFEVAYPTRDGFKKVDRLLFRAWFLPETGEYKNSGRSFFLRYVGEDLYISAFNPEEKTYLIKSPIGQTIAPAAEEYISPDWTLDLFVAHTGQIIELARYQPRQRSVSDAMQFADGVLIGWSWDKDYVDAIADKARKAIASGSRFEVQRY